MSRQLFRSISDLKFPFGLGLVLIGIFCIYSSLSYEEEKLHIEIAYTSFTKNNETIDVTADIINKYDYDISIKEVMLTCVCVTAHVDNREIPRNKKTKLSFSVNRSKIQKSGSQLGVLLQLRLKNNIDSLLFIPVPRSTVANDKLPPTSPGTKKV